MQSSSVMSAEGKGKILMCHERAPLLPLAAEKHPRFGPLYRRDQDDDSIMESSRDDAWNVMLSKEGGVDAEKKQEIFNTYMKDVKKVLLAEAKDFYDSDDLPEIYKNNTKKFLELLCKDGCFFLQLALFLLGATSEELGHSSNHLTFGDSVRTDEKKMKDYIYSMFYPGNQIPLVVLRQLLKQPYFLDVISKSEIPRKRPEDMFKRILYDLLELDAKPKAPAQLGSSNNRGPVRSEQSPSDVLACLHRLVLGPAKVATANASAGDTEGTRAILDSEENDLEAGNNNDNNNNKGLTEKYTSATELQEAGIDFKNISMESEGIRGVRFSSGRLFFNATLYLPVLKVEDDTELMFQLLRAYEMSQEKISKTSGEVSAYLWFMSRLIAKQEDAKLLESVGIIKATAQQKGNVAAILRRLGITVDGNSNYKRLEKLQKLSNYLKQLASGCNVEKTDQHLRLLRLQIDDYANPAKKFKKVLNFVALLTLIQTILALLSYIHPRGGG